MSTIRSQDDLFQSGKNKQYLNKFIIFYNFRTEPMQASFPASEASKRPRLARPQPLELQPRPPGPSTFYPAKTKMELLLGNKSLKFSFHFVSFKKVFHTIVSQVLIGKSNY